MKPTRKILQILLPLVLLLCVFASCEGNAAEPKQTTAATVATTTAPLTGYITADGAQAVELISNIHKGEDVGIPTFEYVPYQSTVEEVESFLQPLTEKDDCAMMIIERYDYAAYTYVSLIDGKYYSMRLTSTLLENGDTSRLAEKMTAYDYYYRIDQKAGDSEFAEFVLTTVEGLTAEQIRSMILDSVQFDPYTSIVYGVGMEPPPEEKLKDPIDSKFISLDPNVVVGFFLESDPWNNLQTLWRSRCPATSIIIKEFTRRGNADHAMLIADTRTTDEAITAYIYLCRVNGKYFAARITKPDLNNLDPAELTSVIAAQLAEGYDHMLDGLGRKNSLSSYHLLYITDDPELTADDILADEGKNLLPARRVVKYAE